MAHQNTFYAQSPPVLESNAFNGLKYLCDTFKYIKKPVITESSSNKVFVDCFFK